MSKGTTFITLNKRINGLQSFVLFIFKNYGILTEPRSWPQCIGGSIVLIYSIYIIKNQELE